MKNKQVHLPYLQGIKLYWVFGITAGILVLAGSIFGVDWTNYFFHIQSLYPAIAKPAISLLAMVLVLMTGKHALENRDWWLLLLAFCCMLPTDILMTVVIVSPSLSVGSSVFMVGGVLSIIAHLFLIVRVSRGLPYLKNFWKGKRYPVRHHLRSEWHVGSDCVLGASRRQLMKMNPISGFVKRGRYSIYGKSVCKIIWENPQESGDERIGHPGLRKRD
jgi:hypothetical protein